MAKRKRLVDGCRKGRAEIDAFKPDVVLVWGDDQSENFQEAIIPAFSILAYDSFACHPMVGRSRGQRPNVWAEPAAQVFRHPGPAARRPLHNPCICISNPPSPCDYSVQPREFATPITDLDPSAR